MEENLKDCLFQQDGTSAHAGKQHRYSYMTSSLIVLSDVDSDHHDPQNLCHLISVSEYFWKKESYSITPRVPDYLKHNIEQPVASTEEQALRKVAKQS